jgi:hypothetical protein
MFHQKEHLKEQKKVTGFSDPEAIYSKKVLGIISQENPSTPSDSSSKITATPSRLTRSYSFPNSGYF